MLSYRLGLLNFTTQTAVIINREASGKPLQWLQGLPSLYNERLELVPRVAKFYTKMRELAPDNELIKNTFTYTHALLKDFKHLRVAIFKLISIL